VGNEVRQRASKDLANNLNLAVVTIYTFLLFFCCFGCHRGKKPGNKGFSPATGSATG
ncbi:tweety protein, partial [Roseburia faecis]|uniref:tweety protein n=1 Tax=Roseburia faecis TaxID=301302 RepID=UPI002FE6F0D6